MPPLKRTKESNPLLALFREMNSPCCKWIVKVGKPVTLTPMADLPEIAEQVRELRPRKKQCFSNAKDCMMAIPGVRVVQGWAMFHGCPIEHAWNEFKGLHFDLTAERHRLGIEGYFQVITLTEPEYWKLAGAAGEHNPVVRIPVGAVGTVGAINCPPVRGHNPNFMCVDFRLPGVFQGDSRLNHCTWRVAAFPRQVSVLPTAPRG